MRFGADPEHHQLAVAHSMGRDNLDGREVSPEPPLLDVAYAYARLAGPGRQPRIRRRAELRRQRSGSPPRRRRALRPLAAILFGGKHDTESGHLGSAVDTAATPRFRSSRRPRGRHPRRSRNCGLRTTDGAVRLRDGPESCAGRTAGGCRPKREKSLLAASLWMLAQEPDVDPARVPEATGAPIRRHRRRDRNRLDGVGDQPSPSR